MIECALHNFISTNVVFFSLYGETLLSIAVFSPQKIKCCYERFIARDVHAISIYSRSQTGSRLVGSMLSPRTLFFFVCCYRSFDLVSVNKIYTFLIPNLGVSDPEIEKGKLYNSVDFERRVTLYKSASKNGCLFVGSQSRQVSSVPTVETDGLNFEPSFFLAPSNDNLRASS